MANNGRKHFEGHGNHWEAFTNEETGNVISQYLPKTTQEGKLVENRVTQLGNDKVIFSAVYPKSGEVQLCASITNRDNDKAFEVMSFHPIFEGIENDIVVNEIHAWEDNVAGVVCASVGKIDLSFFAPYFYNEFAHAEKDEKHRVKLAGLALIVENAQTGCEINEGALYEMALETFLDENPDKTKADFPSVGISFDGLPILFPSDFYTEYEFRGKIFESTDVFMDEGKFKKLKICVGRKHDIDEIAEVDDDFFINLYVAWHVGAECNLDVGNDIQGYLWLMGIKSSK